MLKEGPLAILIGFRVPSYLRGAARQWNAGPKSTNVSVSGYKLDPDEKWLSRSFVRPFNYPKNGSLPYSLKELVRSYCGTCDAMSIGQL